jgi:hypothetical protein
LNFHTPSHSPNLGPLDFHMCGWLKEALYGQRFAIDDEVKDVVKMWLHSQLETFFAYGIRRPVNCYTIHVKKRGFLCWEWYTLHLSHVVREVTNKFTLLSDSALSNVCWRVLCYSTIWWGV